MKKSLKITFVINGIPQDDVFRFETIETREPYAGEVQVESIYVSVDPYMRGRMNDT
ncbi:hypothetical protein BU091_05030, partial [Staphylococcus warneri]